jgi:hypothetical protein
LRVGKSTTSEGKEVDNEARVGNEVRVGKRRGRRKGGLILPRPMKRCLVVVVAACYNS